MSRPALYRLYRPADLSDVVGQDHIVRALEAALAAGRVGHAYLLTGPRGTGKTSVARILARRMNELPAEHDIASELDILEIDAASNRGIDEIRALRDKIAISPSHLRYKVFIIDEVHMLTREAFNALLKTLEEPPAHAVFILATTEAHKLPDTVISRTQRFDFHPVRPDDMVTALAAVAKLENIDIDTEALGLIAQLASGGFRDALGLLDQLSAQPGKIDRATVAEMTGIGDAAVLRSLLVAATEGKFDVALESLSEIWSRGGEPTLVLEHLLLIVRDEFLDTTREQPLVPRPKLYQVLMALTEAAREIKFSPIPSLPLELALWRLSNPSIPATQSVAAPVQQAAPVKSPTPSRPAVRRAPVSQAASMPEGSLSPQLITTKALSLIKAKNNSLYAVLRSGEPSLEGDQFVIRCRFRFHKERIEEHKNRQLIEAVLTKVAGRPVEMQVVHTGAEPQATTQPEEELVASALEILGGEVVED